MEFRKLQPTGGSSFSITLPKKWIERLGLKAKDRVILHERRSDILAIQPERSRKPLMMTLGIDGLPDVVIVRELIAHYISGADAVSIDSKHLDPKRRALIRSITRSFIGFEVIEGSGEHLILRNVFDASKFPIPQAIEKLFFVARSMLEDALVAASTGDRALARDIIDRDTEADKLQFALKRQYYSMLREKTFDSELGMSMLQLHYYEGVAQQLERIADHALKIAHVTVVTGERLSPSAARLFEKVAARILDVLAASTTMIASVDKSKAHKILGDISEIERLTELNKKALSGRSSTALIIGDSFDRIRGYIMNMAELTLDQAITEQGLK